MLRFYEFDHDVGLEDGKILSKKAITASSGHYLSWEPELRGKCLEIAGPVMTQLGFTVDMADLRADYPSPVSSSRSARAYDFNQRTDS